MPSAITVADFEDEQILTFEELNAFKDAVIARFSAGIASGDIGWPLTAQGNLDMSVYNILGGRQIWGFVNAAEYDTLADAISAAGTGGVVLIPPETTIVTAGGEVHSGSGATIIGSGPSSVLKFDASPSAGYLLRADAGTGLMFSNLTFDGNSAAGSGQIGLDLQGVSNVLIDGCWFQNFSGPALNISNGCSGVKVRGCWFTGGSAEHIYATESGRLGIYGVTSVSAGTIAIRLQSSGASAEVIAMLDDVFIDTPGSNGISAYGANATGSSSPAEVYANAVKIKSPGADAAVLGTSAQALARVAWTGGVVYGPSGDGLVVHASEGVVSGGTISTIGGTNALDLGTSRHLNVSGVTLKSASVGIDASATAAACLVTDNHMISCTTEILLGGTDLVQRGNGDQVGAPGVNCYYNLTAYVHPADGAAHQGNTITIPADTLQVGSVLKVTAQVDTSGAAFTDGMNIRFDGNNVAVGTLKGAGTETLLWAVIVFDSATSLMSVYHDSCEDQSVDPQAGNVVVSSGIDLTADNDLDISFTIPGGSGGTSKFLSVEVLRGEAVV
jgi:hypothetical protein